MELKTLPRFYGFRIYFTAVVLYFFLVLPFIAFLAFQQVPALVARHELQSGQDTGAMIDSLRRVYDTIPEITEEQIDSIIAGILEDQIEALDSIQPEIRITLSDSLRHPADSLSPSTDSLNHPADSMAELKQDSAIVIPFSPEDEEEESNIFQKGGHFPRYFALFFPMLLVSLILGLIYNYPFKRYFRYYRKKQEIPDKLKRRCKKELFRLPLLNSLIVTLPNITVIVYTSIFLFTEASFADDVEREMIWKLHLLTMMATLLEILFVYYWVKHRVHLRYIDFIFSKDELRAQVFQRKGGKIRNRFLLASGMTTFLPLLIVMGYLLMSLSAVKDLGLTEFNQQQRDILIGPWSKIAGKGEESVSIDKYEKLYYVNAIDSIVMLVGIGNGILVSFIYLILFIRWTSKDISRPLRELIYNMRNTRSGEEEQYTIVRSNDEVGELAEGYNEMTRQIHDYVKSISAMNRELEEKVRERTREVVEQKEEIEAQKEEIEAQLDLATLQRDTITFQKEQILDSIYYAERIQAAILPPVDLLSALVPEHFILFRPRDIVSGDFYWASEKQGKILIAAADCTGHGVPGGFLSMLGISSMNEIVNRNPRLDAGKILEELRKIVIQSLHQTGTRGEAQDGIEIALCIIDPKSMKLQFAGANRPLYLLRDHRIEHIRPDRMPIGIYEQESVPFTRQDLDLKKGDSLYLFSDGYVDQLGGPKRKTFRAVHFRKLLLGFHDIPMEEQKEILLKKHREWKGDVEQIDDILVMGIRL